MRPALVLLGVCVFGWPSVAHACDPLSSVLGVLPPIGAIIPANAVLIARGGSLHFTSFHLLVDGDEVDAEPVARVSGGGGSAVGLRAVERPPVGSELELQFCPEEGDCTVVGVWTLTEPDDESPDASTAVQYDYVEHDGCPMTSCDQYEQHRVGHVQVETDTPESEDVVVVIRVRTTDEAPSQPYFLATGDPSPAVAFPLSDDMHPGVAAGDAICVEVRVFDWAGNEADGGIETCSPCHTGINPTSGECTPTDPQWTDADLFPGGDCAGAPVEPLPPLPAPAEPPNGTTGSGTGRGTTGSSTGDEDLTSSSTSETGGLDSTTTDAATSGVASTTLDPGPSTEGERESDTSGAADGDGSSSGGCSSGSAPRRARWLALAVFGLLGRRRRV